MLKVFTKHLFLCLLLITVMTSARAQTSEITGIVKDETGQPLIGSSILLLNTKTNEKKGVMVNADGKFLITGLSPNVPYNISASFIGYTTKTIEGYLLKAGEQATLLIQLLPASSSLTDVVVVGYGSQKKKDVTTAIASIKASDLENQPINNAAEAMVGKMAGVQVAQGSGAPGSALSIKVRGVGTITAGSSPLYVVDGVPINGDNINTLNTNDIASIEVLKDASSAAIYGSRGSNGVVLITTKQGKSGAPTFNINSYAGLQSVANKVKMMDAYQYAELVRDARNNTYADAMDNINRRNTANNLPVVPYSLNDDNGLRLQKAGINNNSVIIPVEVLPYLQGQQNLINTDWQDAIFRTAPIQNHSISASGGSEDLKYYASLEYYDQDGIIINSNFKRYNGRLNLEGKSGVFKYGVNFSPSLLNEKKVNSDGTYAANGGGIISSALHYAPIWPIYNNDGSYSFAQNSWSGDATTTLPGGAVGTGNSQTQAYNPVALAMLQRDDVLSNRLLGNTFLEVSFLKDFKYKVQLGIDIFNLNENTFRPSTFPLSNTKGNPLSEASGSAYSSRQTNWLLEQTLSYAKTIGNHNFNFLAGWSTQKDDLRGTYALASKGFISNQITELKAGLVTNGNSTHSQWDLASGIARLQYSYKGKYLFTSSIRADGSSRFGTDNKWGYFPSASVGWRLSEENFLKNSKTISDLKLRLSYGQTGNFKIGNYASQGILGNDGYILGTNPSAINGVSTFVKPNENLHWEKTAQLNMGFDIAFFQNGLSLSVDAYNSNTRDLLLDVPVPISTGFSTELINIGKVNNKGIDINLGTEQQFGGVKWVANANFSKNLNKVVELGPGNADIIKTGSVTNAYFLTRVGQAIGSYYLPVVLGVFKNQAEVNAYPHFMDTPANYDLATSKPGDFKFKDVDGDGVIDLTKDREIVGNYLPKFTYGFATSAEYKGIDLNIALQGVYGNKILNLARRYFANKEGNMNNVISSLDRWKSESNPGSGQDVRANRISKGNNGVTSTWHIEDGSYLRIRNIALGYTFPTSFTKKMALNKVRLYVAMQNPFTFTKYTGYNPEVTNRSEATTNGEDYGVYPTAKTTSIGINISL